MKRLGLALLTGSVLTLSGLAGCSPASFEEGAPETETQAIPQAASDSEPSAADASDVADTEVARDESQQRPQLVKRASLVLSVESVEDALEQVRSLITTQQGDILSLRDQGESNRDVRLELRVPQDQLDAVLGGLVKLGTVRSRSITTEDVSSQLVDLQARLNNSRKSEEALQEIMSRSGEISDVLEVSRELSNVRQEIEQMAAAQKNLQTRVRYSTVTVRLESVIALSPVQTPLGQQLSSTWTSATHSFGNLTTDLLQLGLWLLVYSPYIFLLLGGAAFYNKVRRSTHIDG